ncbi:Transmembrane gamma-carboxyglutamic acid protein like [Heracleum sosnowskyi]|uniref:Transmembrane gamma-carboxyglutamic acid protein like n=1 Tax=Heracleum sosnowskyi TaxID=360622 RepID=A0AAD8HRE5_9APIA|nr:Transmembrane gamma-carboxyglutamic acid protein like [Heracleum sosnowskyi]
MDKFQDQTAFSCELRIARARNVELDSKGSLFVRCYMSAGNKNRVRFETPEVSSSNMVWNQSFCLDCFGTKESMSNMLLEGTVIFELRWRSGVCFFGRTGKSHLLGKAQVPWKTVFESSTMNIEKWLVMETRKSLSDGVKPPAVQIGMNVEGTPLSATKAVKRSKSCGDRCQCKSCLNSQLFALDGALEFSC